MSLSHGPSLAECQHFLLLLSRRRAAHRSSFISPFIADPSSASLGPLSFCLLKLFQLVCNLVFFFPRSFSSSSSSPSSCAEQLPSPRTLRSPRDSGGSCVSQIKTQQAAACPGRYLKSGQISSSSGLNHLDE